jgi:ATP-dependent DNA helicase RecG
VVGLDTALKGLLGEKTERAIKRAFGYTTVAELLQHFPRRYASRGELTALSGVPVGEPVTIVAEVVSTSERTMQKRRGSLLEVTLTDGTGLLTLTFFNQAWRSRELRPGARGIFAGKVSNYRGGKQLAHPDYELFDEEPNAEASHKWAETPIPIYPAKQSLASWQIQKTIGIVLDQLDPLDEPLPDELRSRHDLLTYRDALMGVHRPERAEQWKQGQKTLRFHEALLMQLALLQQRETVRSAGSPIRLPAKLTEEFEAALPFAFTADQAEVNAEIQNDLASGHPMHRLVQGEVGSGKTVVALRAMVIVAEDGGQATLLAPTEVLAAQHLRSIVKTLGPDLSARLMPTLLTGGMGATERKRAELAVASGQARIVVGTHALLSDSVQFHDLGLVVVDEQHRFGVNQRDILRHKGTNPHVLVLTATPIPRTVAMTVFGDVDTSTIKGVPEGRQPISTHLVALAEHPDWYGRIWSRAEEEIYSGHQVFVVCPAIDPGEVEEADEFEEEPVAPLTSVTELAKELVTHPQLGARRIAILHGRMDSASKDQVMSQFQAGEIDLLIATTVIEVGVDVPRATAMVVMDADRFGISQLHQLRGRVGRGGWPGLCLLVTHQVEGTLARERLDAVVATTDGFELARADLELRREGDVLGRSQSGGRSGLKLLRVTADGDVIDQARQDAEEILGHSSDLAAYPTLAEHLQRRLADVDREFLDRS